MGTLVLVSVLILGLRAPKTPAAKEVVPSPCLHAHWYPHMHSHNLIHTHKHSRLPSAARVCVDVHVSCCHQMHMNALDLCCYLWSCWCPRPEKQAMPPRPWHPMGPISGQDHEDKWILAVVKPYVGLWPCGCQYLRWCPRFLSLLRAVGTSGSVDDIPGAMLVFKGHVPLSQANLSYMHLKSVSRWHLIPRLLQRTISGSIVLLRLGFVLIVIACAITKGDMDVGSLGHHLGPY